MKTPAPLPVPVERLWDVACRRETVKQRFGTGSWRVTDLHDAVKDQPVFDLPLAHIDLGAHDFDTTGGLLGFARHMKHVLDADLTHPITLDEWGGVIDGRHRIVKALYLGHATIKARRVPPGIRPTETDP